MIIEPDTTLIASAPGKLILLGEYSVLAGGPAISVAVGRRAVASLTAADKSILCISHTGERLGFDLQAAAVSAGAPANAQLLRAAASVLRQDGINPATLPPLRIELDSSAFYETGPAGTPAKLGLGSSAAVCVVLMTVLQQALNAEVDSAQCMAAHHAFQNSQGSGLDVLTSWHGGVIGVCGDGQVETLVWPDGLYVTPVWTGVSAATPDMLARVARFRADDENGYAAHMQQLSEHSDQGLRNWRANDSDALLTSVALFAAQLEAFDADAGIGIWSPEHLTLAKMAQALGLVYKPSGAGGGDFGLVMGRDTDALLEFETNARYAGFALPELELSVAGLETSVQRR